MASKSVTVRLDAEAQRNLRQIRAGSGYSVSDAVKEGLRALVARDHARAGESTPYEILMSLELGRGDAIAPATDVRGGMRIALERKRKRWRARRSKGAP